MFAGEYLSSLFYWYDSFRFFTILYFFSTTNMYNRNRKGKRCTSTSYRKLIINNMITKSERHQFQFFEKSFSQKLNKPQNFSSRIQPYCSNINEQMPRYLSITTNVPLTTMGHLHILSSLLLGAQVMISSTLRIISAASVAESNTACLTLKDSEIPSSAISPTC